MECACRQTGKAQCPRCKRRNGKAYTATHRDRMLAERLRLTKERDELLERCCSVEGELTEMRNLVSLLIDLSPQTCLQCGSESVPPNFVSEMRSDATSDKTRLKECSNFLDHLKIATKESKSQRPRQSCKQCCDESCSTCLRRKRSREGTMSSRAKRNDELVKCAEYLRWAVREILVRNGQISNLRSHVKQLHLRIPPRCTTCGSTSTASSWNPALPRHLNDAVPTSSLDCYQRLPYACDATYSCFVPQYSTSVPPTVPMCQQGSGPWPSCAGADMTQQGLLVSCTQEELHRFSMTASQPLEPDNLQLNEGDLELVSEYLAEQYNRPVIAQDVATSGGPDIATTGNRISGGSSRSSVEQAKAIWAPETFFHVGYAMAEDSRSSIAQKLREAEDLLAAFTLNVARLPQTTIREADERCRSDDTGTQCYELADNVADTTSDYETMSTVSRSTTLAVRKQALNIGAFGPVEEEEDDTPLRPPKAVSAGEGSDDKRQMDAAATYTSNHVWTRLPLSKSQPDQKSVGVTPVCSSTHVLVKRKKATLICLPFRKHKKKNMLCANKNTLGG